MATSSRPQPPKKKDAGNPAPEQNDDKSLVHKKNNAGNIAFVLGSSMALGAAAFVFGGPLALLIAPGIVGMAALTAGAVLLPLAVFAVYKGIGAMVAGIEGMAKGIKAAINKHPLRTGVAIGAALAVGIMIAAAFLPVLAPIALPLAAIALVAGIGIGLFKAFSNFFGGQKKEGAQSKQTNEPKSKQANEMGFFDKLAKDIKNTVSAIKTVVIGAAIGGVVAVGIMIAAAFLPVLAPIALPLAAIALVAGIGIGLFKAFSNFFGGQKKEGAQSKQTNEPKSKQANEMGFFDKLAKDIKNTVSAIKTVVIGAAIGGVVAVGIMIAAAFLPVLAPIALPLAAIALVAGIGIGLFKAFSNFFGDRKPGGAPGFSRTNNGEESVRLAQEAVSKVAATPTAAPGTAPRPAIEAAPAQTSTAQATPGAPTPTPAQTSTAQATPGAPTPTPAQTSTAQATPGAPTPTPAQTSTAQATPGAPTSTPTSTSPPTSEASSSVDSTLPTPPPAPDIAPASALEATPQTPDLISTPQPGASVDSTLSQELPFHAQEDAASDESATMEAGTQAVLEPAEEEQPQLTTDIEAQPPELPMSETLSAPDTEKDLKAELKENEAETPDAHEKLEEPQEQPPSLSPFGASSSSSDQAGETEEDNAQVDEEQSGEVGKAPSPSPSPSGASSSSSTPGGDAVEGGTQREMVKQGIESQAPGLTQVPILGPAVVDAANNAVTEARQRQSAGDTSGAMPSCPGACQPQMWMKSLQNTLGLNVSSTEASSSSSSSFAAPAPTPSG